MRGVYLPGQRRVVVREDLPDPEPGHGQVLLRMRASTICGSDLRAIYREHLGTGPEAYQDVVAGHEPSGEVVVVGPGCVRLAPGDRVAVYHIAGCGQCRDCQDGYFISCTSPRRAAYGWQRDGGHADLMVAEEDTCIVLPDSLSYLDGACVACGFGTAYQALLRAKPSGRDDLLVTGLGPVGLAVAILGAAFGVSGVVGVDPSPQRRQLALDLGLVEQAVPTADELAGGFSVTVDCSGSSAGRLDAVRSTARWGRCVLVGEGGAFDVPASPLLIHPQLTVMGSWVTSVGRMHDLVGLLHRRGLRPERIVTHRFPLAAAAEAYEIADAGAAGKVAVVFDEVSA
ncbi:MAG: alcohol dehydrogenase catalytic domain-containing protein [Streptosporangiales bacterium]|nr:alcohol dehydrogenase catalytic domain-containing protein [Streptosporangiales bacterium]